jgi:hypothetical protein
LLYADEWFTIEIHSEERRNALMPDSRNQAAFVAALRQKAEELAASDPVLEDLRMVGKTLVDEFRRRVAAGSPPKSMGGYLAGGSVSLIVPETTDEQAGGEILFKLRTLAHEGKIQAAAMCTITDRLIPPGGIQKFLSVHVEHSTGRALLSSVPTDESVLMRGVQGVNGPAMAMSGGRTNPVIFTPIPNDPA